MKRLLIAAAAVAVVAVLALAACGGGGGGSDNASAPSSAGTATVSVKDLGDSGAVLVDSAGKALYESDQEAADPNVLCTDACEDFWQPLTIDSGMPTGNDVPGKLGVAKRPDGTRQVTLDGRRLYSFVQDDPGEVTGEGFSDAFGGQTFTWHVVNADGSTGNQGGSTSNSPYNY
jgi:predicted lipoprotein with Yx(FWY)xxD motif